MSDDGQVIQGNFGGNGKPWPDNAWPTPEQFADWYIEQPREERVRLAEWVIFQGQASERCILQNHEGRIEQADAALRSLYRQAANTEADR